MMSEKENMIDVTAPCFVEVEISTDCKRLWINVDGICRFRACGIETLIVASWPPEMRLVLKPEGKFEQGAVRQT